MVLKNLFRHIRKNSGVSKIIKPENLLTEKSSEYFRNPQHISQGFSRWKKIFFIHFDFHFIEVSPFEDADI